MDIQALLASPAGLAIKGALIAAVLDFLFGVFAAVKDGTFAIDAIGAWLRKHLVGRVLPCSILALVAYYSGDLVAVGIAAGALTTYAAETMGSIYGSIRPPAPSQEPTTKAEAAAEVINPIPVD